MSSSIKNRGRAPLIILLAFCASIIVLRAGNIQLPMIFKDGMVLQRGKKVPIWGWANPGAKVTIKFSIQTRSSKADSKGKWTIWLDPLKTSAKGSTLTISCNGEKKTIGDVVVGEVWFCTGQSNMDHTANGFARPKSNPAAAALSKYIHTLNDPLIRQYAAPYALGHDGRKERAEMTYHGNFKDNSKIPGICSWIKATSPTLTRAFSGTALCFALALRKALPKVPIGLIKCAWGGTPIETWIPQPVFDSNPKMKEEREKYEKKVNAQYEQWKKRDWEPAYKAKLEKWKKQLDDNSADEKGKSKKPRKPSPPRNPLDPMYPKYPCSLFNAMIAPLVPYAARGFIWYQGEANAFVKRDQDPPYGRRLAMMIKAWRKEWGDDNMPFYFVQLANFASNRKNSSGQDTWAVVMDQQRRVLDMVPHTGMSVSIDIGDSRSIHPKNKIDVGERLALWALKLDYGKKIPECSGPLFKSDKIKNGKIIITFSHVGKGLMTGSKVGVDPVKPVKAPPTWFEVKGQDGEWHKAEAKITGKDKIEVFSKDVPKPVAARYAWSCDPKGANLYNKSGLPASPFTTEKE